MLAHLKNCSQRPPNFKVVSYLSWHTIVPAKQQAWKQQTMTWILTKRNWDGQNAKWQQKSPDKVPTNNLAFCPLAFCPTTFYFTWFSLSWGWWHSLSANPSILLNSLSFASTFSVSAVLAMTRYLLGFALALPLLCTYDLDQVEKWDVW